MENRTAHITVASDAGVTANNTAAGHRHLVLGLDGTWNTPDQLDRDRQCPSNVVKLLRAIDTRQSDVEQLKYYDAGVGTDGFVDKLWGGIAGRGLFGNMRQAYVWLLENYRIGDQLFLFGFSRGAFAVRSLVAMIDLCGIPKRVDYSYDFMDVASEAARIYREPIKTKQKRMAREFRNRFHAVDATVTMLGVWDTVGAMGLPTQGLLGKLTRSQHQFHNTRLSKNVRHAYQALAMNEMRRPFEPALWRGKCPKDVETVEQVWFPGVHGNIGGGYADAGLSDVALEWMLEKAANHGLTLRPNYLINRVDPNPFAEMRDPIRPLYRSLMIGRPRVRRIGSGAIGEAIDLSAARRWLAVSRPEAPPANFLVDSTRAKNRQQRAGEYAHRRNAVPESVLGSKPGFEYGSRQSRAQASDSPDNRLMSPRNKFSRTSANP
ncbi:MAG: DUF2235 domain-containing protein [Pseudohongiella nitratireducens]|nr:DUF2235 domain-containing protein [Pseudohongiella nitratireducens]MDF1623515.1 DUF2235 domain-containing protein [Pseudohongiella nitratireducens]